MPRYAVLLRGINVGGHKKIAMADLRALLTRLGHADVGTLLQSGNAVFSSADDDADRLARQLEEAIVAEFDMRVRCLVRSDAEVRAVIAGNPFDGVATDGSRLLALFLAAPPDHALLARHDPAALAPGQVVVGERVIYQWCPDGISQAPLVGAFVEKQLKVAMTARNWNTVTKLAALLDA